MSGLNNHIDSSTSAYLTSGYEGLDTRFGDFSTMAGQGYCDLYRAKRYGRWFLLKCLKAEHQDDAAHQQMLRKELEVLMRLQHPGVMQVVGMEEVKLPDRGKTMCVVAEWIDGMTLAEYLAQNPTKRQLRRVALELADTLRYVHQQQVVHRDLKPSNVMITHNGSYVKLIDFGLADTDSHALLKQPAGTMRYMAPEQARLAQADVRNDIYSLGVIMQEMNRVQGGAVPRRIVDRCLAPIDQRWQDMDQLCDALRQSQRRRRNMMVAAAALTVAAVVAGLVWQIGKLRRQADDMDSRAALMSHQLRVLNREIIDFDDEQVRRKCIDHWDTDGDGELSYDEAAAVTSLGQVFTADTTITAFNELEHFTGLEEIGRDAFYGCTRLYALRLPHRVRYIRANAFRNSGLEMLTVPSTVLGIGDHCMDDCPRLHTVIVESMFPNTNDGVVPLQNCPSLTTVFVPKFVAALSEFGHFQVTWEALRPLINAHIRFADPAVEAICLSRWDRDGNGELTIDEAKAVKSLDAAFSGHSEIRSFDELRDFTGREEIGMGDFQNCSGLRHISRPSTIRHIRDYSFFKCLSLADLQLPMHLQSIGHDAIESHAIDSIYIPAATTSLTSTSLLSCGHLRRVVVSPQNPVYDSRDNCNGIVVTATNQLLTGFPGTRIPRSVTSLSDEAFNSLDLEELTIPAQITRIGPWSLVSSIGRIYLESPVPPAYDSEGGQLLIVAYGIGLYPNPDVYVPIGSLEAYAKADGWNRLAHLMREYPAAPCHVPSWPYVSASLTTCVPMHSNGSNFPALMP